MDTGFHNSVALLRNLIATPSFSKEEGDTAAILYQYLLDNKVEARRHLNNVWALNKSFDPSKPTLLLNSHHDTVKPNTQYQLNPYEPLVKEDRLYGLGSNDAGGPLVSLIACFLFFAQEPVLPWNLVLAATAEEEISGINGIEALLKAPEFIQATNYDRRETGAANWCAIVGEPTQMQLAVAEKGLLVLDIISSGKAGHAAREEGVNAIYQAMAEIEWFRTYQFARVSPTLGPVKMNVTVIHSENRAHNMVPASCHYTVDIRVTDAYTHEEILAEVKANIPSEVQARSLRMRATGISEEHPLVLAGLALGKKTYGFPTCSDKALMPFPALKCGPGDSARSHSADEFIYLSEIEAGITDYIKLVKGAMNLS